MRVIRGLTHLEPLQQGCLLTIGNFDGVHLGHQAVIHKLAQHAKTLNLPVVVMIFEPQPLEYFLKADAPPRLMRLREKVSQFNRLPVNDLLVLKFNQHFANLEADAFIQHILLEKLNVKHLVVGDDFHFGKARRGNFALLQAAGLRYGFTVEDTCSTIVEGLRVSSTAIRQALASGDLAKVEQLLGRPYSICGRVIKGEQLGRTLGYPTANIQLSRKNSPLSGVFAVLMTGLNGRQIRGVANVGTRPTVTGEKNVILETHLFDFDDNCYGQAVEVHFMKKLRDEQHFASLNDLKAQIAKDAIAANAFFLST
ncbi:MAG: bifunctional riboflavin kinase/FAD synthetase [Methylococcales bacterium]|nr:bifunctional riboflavin kinase/FAD synthetase [Methylococcales bacterium]